MLSRALSKNSRLLGVCFNSAHSSAVLPVNSDGIVEKDILCDASESYRELSTHDKMNDYVIQISEFGDPLKPLDPKQREPILESIVVAQYETEDATVNLSAPIFPNLPTPETIPIGHPYSWLGYGGFESLRQRKFLSAQLMDTHPSRNYHRGRPAQGVQGVPPRRFQIREAGSPQGIQGFGCEYSNVWEKNCVIVHHQCVPENQFHEGRKTLAQVFSEQKSEIENAYPRRK